MEQIAHLLTVHVYVKMAILERNAIYHAKKAIMEKTAVKNVYVWEKCDAIQSTVNVYVPPVIEEKLVNKVPFYINSAFES